MSHPSRRDFLRASGLAAATAMAGCSVDIAGYKLEIGKDAGTSTAGTTDIPTGTTPAGGGTAPAGGTTSTATETTIDLEFARTLEVEPIYLETTAGDTATDTDQYVRKSFELSDFQIRVEEASDAAFDGPNNLEIGGLIVWGADSVVERNSKERLWARGKRRPVQIQEGELHNLTMRTSPILFDVAYPPSNDLSDYELRIAAEIVDFDDGANRFDRIGSQVQETPLSEADTLQGVTLSNGTSRVWLGYGLYQA